MGLHKLARSWVNNLQNRINYLFPQITAQHALDHLAKKYSDQFEESGRAHQETLENVLESVPKAADQIRNIITRFSVTEKKLAKSAELRANERQSEMEIRLKEVAQQNKSAVDNVQVVIMDQIAKQAEIYREKLNAVEASAKEQRTDLESRLQAISSESMVAIENRIAAVMDQIAAQGQIDQTKLDAAADSVSTLSNNQSNLTMRVQDLMTRQDHDFQTLQNCVQLIIDELGNTEDLTQSDVG